MVWHSRKLLDPEICDIVDFSATIILREQQLIASHKRLLTCKNLKEQLTLLAPFEVVCEQAHVGPQMRVA